MVLTLGRFYGFYIFWVAFSSGLGCVKKVKGLHFYYICTFLCALDLNIYFSNLGLVEVFEFLCFGFSGLTCVQLVCLVFCLKCKFLVLVPLTVLVVTLG